MPEITNKGQRLAIRIHRMTEPRRELDHALETTCSLIARHATTYEHIQERWCNDEMSDRATKLLEQKEAQIEDRIRKLAERIDCTVTFEGDPRSHTVRLWPADARYKTEQDYAGADGLGT
jgi:hypothetical protein